MTRPVIDRVEPQAGVEGGEIILSCSDFEPLSWSSVRVTFEGYTSRPESVSGARVVVPVPSGPSGRVEIKIENAEETSLGAEFHAAEKLADNLHPVANPAFDRDNGTIYTTLSGTRGQQVPISVYKVTSEGEMQPFLSELMNPTGIAFDPDGQMHVTSRFDGTVYRVSPFKEAEPFVRNLGVATGIAFDAEGQLYVGDRSGTIYTVSDIGDPQPFASLEPSMAAYHLAFGPSGDLFVTGPTASSFDCVYRISTSGDVSTYFTGLGRPQGLAFDTAGNLYVVASYRGRRGVFRITPEKEVTMIVAGKALVGLCFDDSGNAILAGTRELYRSFVGVKPYWPF
jgi:sugar lactone lactonase YvrE